MLSELIQSNKHQGNEAYLNIQKIKSLILTDETQITTINKISEPVILFNCSNYLTAS